MASKLFNLVKVATVTTGTGTLTLGAAVPGCLTFAQAGALDNDVVDYVIFEGFNAEIGTGTYNVAGPTLTRTVTKSTNSNAAITLAGAAVVLISPRAETINDATSITTGNIAVARLAGFLANQNAYTAQQSFPLVTLTDAATINWDVSTAQKAKVTIAATGRTMAAVTNAVEGTSYFLWVIQDGSGSRTITTWTSSGAGSYDFGAAGVPVLTTTASRADLFGFEAVTIAGTLKLRFCGIQKGFA